MIRLIQRSNRMARMAMPSLPSRPGLVPHRCPAVSSNDGFLVLTRALNEHAFIASFFGWYQSLGVSCFIVLSASHDLLVGLPWRVASHVVVVAVPSSAHLEMHAPSYDQAVNARIVRLISKRLQEGGLAMPPPIVSRI